ncbi:histidine--tRNA ligase [Effusibacillus lacus]|uniref:Histidine--tRNA ligase n=1 Tax=Effusibacillus lacus TaxID=1348429 RepID=A0A292YN65_9BACL|nr:histidine--tRNA ligase [Effusibacillus lacus]TCS72064.1 histidyl-tRNA synthetase [Effusibacillus lacus]GAX90351.1 histidine--tRNA ligase [Effusibacillus lacus]
MFTSKPRGTYDILPGEVEKWQFVEKVARDVCRRFNYHEIRTPLFEHTELFARGVGETTDIVAKEMYTFTDRGDRSLTLRPEGTAGAVRAFVENKLYGLPQQPTKLYYMGPMFRYERPQAGRNRQFVQFGIEALGTDHPSMDAEILALAMTFLAEVGVRDLSLEINSVGCPECRPVYREQLKQHFAGKLHELCKDCNERYDRNPMRILDCKVDTDKVADAPVMLDHLCEGCKTHFEQLQGYLKDANILFTVNPYIVRGLDYYTKTAFEIIVDGATIIGGGRYNGLVSELGGPETPGIGFGCGVDRVLITLGNQNVELPIDQTLDAFVVTLGEAADCKAVSLVHEMRVAGLAVEKDYLARGMKAQLKAADRLGAKQVVILGDDELAQGIANVKDMETGEQVTMFLNELVQKLQMRKG